MTQNTIQVVKSTNDEKRIATFVVLEPQYDDLLTSDLHQDWYDEDDVFQAMMNFNQNCNKASLFHLVETPDIQFIESYCTPVDFILGERYIRKGTWLATVHCPVGNETADYVWNGIKSGAINGLSIQCSAMVEELDE